MLTLFAGVVAAIVVSLIFTPMRFRVRAGRMAFGAKIAEHRPLPHHRVCKMKGEAELVISRDLETCD